MLALGLLFRSLYVWQLIILESDKNMMVQENPQFPYEVQFKFHGEDTLYSEIFWAESASDARVTAMAGTTASYVKIKSIKRKKS